MRDKQKERAKMLFKLLKSGIRKPEQLSHADQRLVHCYYGRVLDPKEQSV